MSRVGTALATSLVGLASMTLAGSPEVITTPGRATVLVAPDRLVISFGLITSSDSFSEATETARVVSENLKQISVPDMSLESHVDYDLAFMRLQRWGKIHFSSDEWSLTYLKTDNTGQEVEVDDRAQASSAEYAFTAYLQNDMTQDTGLRSPSVLFKSGHVTVFKKLCLNACESDRVRIGLTRAGGILTPAL